MNLKRKQHLSLYYWTKNQLPDFINTIYNFPVRTNEPDGKLKIPTVSVVARPTREFPLELGGKNADYRSWSIDIFAKNEIQRDDLAYLIYDNLEDGIDVFDYDQGFPPEITPNKIGQMIVESREVEPIIVFPELVKDLYWRSTITFITKFTEV